MHAPIGRIDDNQSGVEQHSNRSKTRDMLTILSFWVHDMRPAEFYGPAGTLGELYRYGDTSEPLTVMLTSSDETEVIVPESVTIPADETTVTFPIDLVDDTLLDGEQLVFITATAGLDSTDALAVRARLRNGRT